MEGPDLDGDGLAEVAVGSPDADGWAEGQGRVSFFRGSDLAAGRADLFAPFATVEAEQQGMGFGAELRWYDDRDGDGIADLMVAERSLALTINEPERIGDVYFVSGASLLTGGTVAPVPFASAFGPGLPVPWTDVDGDGAEDWVVLLAPPEGEFTPETTGGLYVLLDTDFTPSGFGPAAATLTWESDDNWLGAWATSLALDGDGDGLDDLLLGYGEGAALLGSASILGGATTVGGVATLTVVTGISSHEKLHVVGDLDGGGVEDLLFASPLGNSIFTLYGEDLSEAAVSPTAVDDVPLMNDFALAGDPDGDGDLDAWFGGDDSVELLDVSDLFAGTFAPRSVLSLDDSVDHVAGSDGAVWLTTKQGSTWAHRDVAWRHDPDGSVLTTLEGGGWGGEAEEAVVRDIDHDGLDDLVFLSDPVGAVHVVSGVQLAAGGDIELCDAEWSFTHSAVGVWIADDVTGDGVDEVVLSDTVRNEGTQHVLDGGTLLSGGGEVELRTFEAGVFDDQTPECATLPDGTAPYVAFERSALVLYDRSIVAGVSPSDARIGSVKGDELSGCAPDLDGDGREDLLLPSGETYWVAPSSLLAADQVIDDDDDWLTLFPGDAANYVPEFQGSLGSETVWGFKHDWADLVWYPLPAPPVTAHGFPDTPVESSFVYVWRAWLEPVYGTEPDIVVLADDTDGSLDFFVFPAGDPSDRRVLNRLDDIEGYEVYSGGPGPGVGGVGAHSLRMRFTDEETQRSLIELIRAD